MQQLENSSATLPANYKLQPEQIQEYADAKSFNDYRTPCLDLLTEPTESSRWSFTSPFQAQLSRGSLCVFITPESHTCRSWLFQMEKSDIIGLVRELFEAVKQRLLPSIN